MAPQPEMNPRDAAAAQALLSGLTEISARAGHDLLGPLNQAASLMALFIKRYRNRLDSEADQLLGFLESASNRMEGVVDGLRKYMSIAGSPPNFGPVDLNVSLASSLALLENSIARTGAVIVSDSLPIIWADPAQMVTIFQLLIGNSIKFCKPEAPPRIQLSSISTGEIKSIAVADNGIGIDPEFSDSVFLPFRRLNGSEYPGVGLGLATAKLITEMHGGNIRIASSPDDPAGVCVQFTVRSA